MGGLLSLLGLGSRINHPTGPDLIPRVQTSIEGVPKSIGAGQNRKTGNCIWYGALTATPDNGGAAGGGKGGIFSGKANTQSYKYTASFILSLGEKIAAINTIYNSNLYDFLVPPSAATTALLNEKGIDTTTGNYYGGTILYGDFSQTGWAYLNSAFPGDALNYRGESAFCVPNLGLGSSPSLPNLGFEIVWDINTDVPAYGPDANPADWFTAFATNTDWGAGFPLVLLAGADLFGEPNLFVMADMFWCLGQLRQWCRAQGLLISPLLTTQTAGNSHLGEVSDAICADFCWQDGLLDIFPYADNSAVGNGYAYAANNTPKYALDQTYLMPVTTGPSVGNGPDLVKVMIDDPTQVPNVIPLTYPDRSIIYNTVTIYAVDDALMIDAGRRRQADVKSHDFFCDGRAANVAASLYLHRSKQLKTFYFRLPGQFADLELFDLVTLTAPLQNMFNQTVRITQITRNKAKDLDFVAEEYLGVAQPPLYNKQQSLGAGRNANAPAGDTLAPVIVEPPAQLADGLQVWIGVSGANLANWGGCYVWTATEEDGVYTNEGVINGASRIGVSTADLPTIAASSSGQTVDNTNTLSVDLTASAGVLASGTSNDMLAQNTACYIGNEIIAYQTATLTATSKYNLAPMVRGAYGTKISDHPIGSTFLRLDKNIVKLAYTPDRVGQQVYVKLQSFNLFGAGIQDIATIGALAYTIQGTALASPLPDVTNLRETFIDQTAGINFDEVVDFRTPQYEIRLGEAWSSATFKQTIAHPPFPVYGDGTYLIKAVARPVAGLVVYSPDAASIALSGTIIADEVIASFDDFAAGWPGKITGPGAIVAGNFQTTTNGSVTYYESPTVYDGLFNRKFRLDVSVNTLGTAASSDILTEDIILDPDILAGSALYEGWVEIMISSDIAGDLFAAVDLFDLPDLFSQTDAAWQKYAPGYSFGRYCKYRVAQESLDPSVVAVTTNLSTEFNVTERLDHVTNDAVGSGGLNLTFQPDGYSRPVGFVYGPDLAPLPHVIPIILNPSQGDYAVVSNLTLTGCTVQAFNLVGAGVARTMNITIEGA